MGIMRAELGRVPQGELARMQIVPKSCDWGRGGTQCFSVSLNTFFCDPLEDSAVQFVFSRTITTLCCLHVITSLCTQLSFSWLSQHLFSLTLGTQLPASVAHPLTDFYLFICLLFDVLNAAVGVEDCCFPVSSCIMYVDLKKP